MNIVKALGVLSAFALAALPSAAIAGESYMRVSVPFSFIVAGQQFAPGDYVIAESNNGLIRVQGGGKGALVISSPEAQTGAAGNTGVRFTSSQAQFYLTSVVEEGEVSRAIPMRAIEQRSVTISSR